MAPTPSPGRWPSNLILDDTAAALLDAQSGERKSRWGKASGGNAIFGNDYQTTGESCRSDTGGASRFFLNVAPDELPIDAPDTLRFMYCPKSSRSERNAGLDGMPEHQRPGAFDDDNYQWDPAKGHRVARPSANHHPTVKPVALMRWLVRLVVPPGGTCLDPFAGSGSTGVACVHEGVRFVGIEQDAEYALIAERRIAHAEDSLVTKPDPQLSLFAAAD